MTARRDDLAAYSLFGGLLAVAGLPIYIHAPKFYTDTYGVSLATLGLVLFGLRLLDVVQDPVLGWLASRLGGAIRSAVAGALALMALSMIGLFAVAPPIAPAAWFSLTLVGLFSTFSFLTICFYARGVSKGDELGSSGHVRVAAWRETGALTGVSLAAVAPSVLAAPTGAPFATFAVCFAILAALAGWAMRGEWRPTAPVSLREIFGPVLADKAARQLLLVALVNATPLAVTSTLFLFFVESRLEAPGWEGPLLVLFFLAAAASAPGWGRLAAAYGPKRVLIVAMVLAIVSFGFAARLGAGDIWPFAVICLASGAAVGADLTLLPAIFSTRLARIAGDASGAFGLWSFVSKFTLALAAATLLPLLDAAGYRNQGTQPDAALAMLTVLYAVVPCLLKLLAIGLLALTPLKEDGP